MSIVKWFPAPIKLEDANLKSRKVCIHMPGGVLILGFDMEDTGKAASDILMDVYRGNQRPARLLPPSRCPVAFPGRGAGCIVVL